MCEEFLDHIPELLAHQGKGGSCGGDYESGEANTFVKMYALVIHIEVKIYIRGGFLPSGDVCEGRDQAYQERKERHCRNLEPPGRGRLELACSNNRIRRH